MYQLVNPLNPMFITGPCLDGCDFADYVSYTYTLYYNSGLNDLNPVWSYNPAYMNYITRKQEKML